MKYLHLFENESEYNSYVNNEQQYEEPFTCLVDDESRVEYNVSDEENPIETDIPIPEDPDNPEEPEDPDTPIPEDPDNPEEPEDPDTPIPEDPDNPEEPENPEEPNE